MRPVPTQQPQLRTVKKEPMANSNPPPPRTESPAYPAVARTSRQPGHVPKMVPPPVRATPQAVPKAAASPHQVQSMVQQLQSMGFAVEAPADPRVEQTAKASQPGLLAVKSPGIAASPPNKKPKTELGPTGYPAKARPIPRQQRTSTSPGGDGSTLSQPASILVDSPKTKNTPPQTAGVGPPQQLFPPAPAGVPRLPGSTLQNAELRGPVVGQPVLNHFGQPVLPTRCPMPTQAPRDSIGLSAPSAAVFPKMQAPMPSRAGPFMYQAQVPAQASLQSPTKGHTQTATQGYVQSPARGYVQTPTQDLMHSPAPNHAQSPGAASSSTPQGKRTQTPTGKLLDMSEKWQASDGSQVLAQDYDWLLQLCIAQQVQLNSVNDSQFPATQVTLSPVQPLPPPPPGPPPPEATYPGEPIPWPALAATNPGKAPAAACQHPSQAAAPPTSANQSEMPQTSPSGKEAVTPDASAAKSGGDAQRFG